MTRVYDFGALAAPAVGRLFTALPGEDAATQLAVDGIGAPRPFPGGREQEISRWITGWIKDKSRSRLLVKDGEDYLVLAKGEIALILTPSDLRFSLLQGDVPGEYPVTARAHPVPNTGRGTTLSFRWPLDQLGSIGTDGRQIVLRSRAEPEVALVLYVICPADDKWNAKGWLAKEDPRKLIRQLAEATGLSPENI